MRINEIVPLTFLTPSHGVRHHMIEVPGVDGILPQADLLTLHTARTIHLHGQRDMRQ